MVVLKLVMIVNNGIIIMDGVLLVILVINSIIMDNVK